MVKVVSSTEAAEAGFLKNVYLNQTAAVRELSYSRDGKRMVFGMSSSSYQRFEIVVIDLPDKNAYGFESEGSMLRLEDDHSSSILSVKFSNDGNQVASSGSDKTIKIWDAINGGSPIVTFNSVADIETLSYNPLRGDRLASGDRKGNVNVWDPTNTSFGYPIMSLVGHWDEVPSIQYSPNGKYIASGSYDETVRIWDVSNGGMEIARFSGHLAGINSVSYSPDGHRVASCSNDGTMRIWDTSDAVLPDDGTRLETMSTVAVIKVEKNEIACDQVLYSADGKMIATGASDVIKIWDVEAIESKNRNGLLWVLTDEGSAQYLSFHPNGNAIAYDSVPYAKVWIFRPPTPSPTEAPSDIRQASSSLHIPLWGLSLLIFPLLLVSLYFTTRRRDNKSLKHIDKEAQIVSGIIT